MKVNLRRFEDLKIRLKKSSKMKRLHEGISRTDLQTFKSSKIFQEFIFKSSYLRRFYETPSSNLQFSWRLNIRRFIRRLMCHLHSELRKNSDSEGPGFFSLIRITYVRTYIRYEIFLFFSKYITMDKNDIFRYKILPQQSWWFCALISPQFFDSSSSTNGLIDILSVFSDHHKNHLYLWVLNIVTSG